MQLQGRYLDSSANLMSKNTTEPKWPKAHMQIRKCRGESENAKHTGRRKTPKIRCHQTSSNPTRSQSESMEMMGCFC